MGVGWMFWKLSFGWRFRGSRVRRFRLTPPPGEGVISGLTLAPCFSVGKLGATAPRVVGDARGVWARLWRLRVDLAMLPLGQAKLLQLGSSGRH